MRRVLSLMLMLLCVSAVCGQCPGGRCGGWAPAPAWVQPMPTYAWVPGPGGYQGLTLDGRQLGVWRSDTGYLPLLSGDSFGAECSPPVSPPGVRDPKCKEGCPCRRDDCECADGKPCVAGCKVESDGRMNFGVGATRQGKGSHYSLSGEAVSREAALDALAGPPPKRLTVIATGEGRAEALKEFAASGAAERALAAGYDSADWAVARSGHRTDGLQIYLQDSDGKVLARSEKPVPAAAWAGKLREPDPRYDSAADPDPLAGTVAALESHQAWAGLLGALTLMGATLKGLFGGGKK